jgi:hypothetical protein
MKGEKPKVSLFKQKMQERKGLTEEKDGFPVAPRIIEQTDKQKPA